MSHRSHPPHRSGDGSSRGHGGQRHDRHASQSPPYYQEPLQSDAHHRAPRRQAAVAHHPRPARRAEFTLAHAGKHFRLGPVAFWTVVGTLVIMAIWSTVTATYFAFHDDVLARLIAREAAMQFAYEDRIAEMRVQVDRVTSRQLLDQEQFELKLEQLARRQSVLESRGAALGGVMDPVTTGSVKPPRGGNPVDAPSSLKPTPMNNTGSRSLPPDREARLELRGSPSFGIEPSPTDGGVNGMLARLQDSLTRLERRQTSGLDAIEASYDAKARRMRGVLADLGLDAGRPAVQPMVGGPFVPAKPPGEGGFERQLYRISLARAQVDRLNRTLAAVPLRRPVTGEIDTTSNFGVRIDPFLGRPAMHTGLDFRGTTGDAIRATAGGVVTHAGWSSGYGQMVEIDHGNGLSTRYGHLSDIETSVGQTVKTGQVVGRLGSSGRSTGPHLHYETRIDGEAVDPERFLRAGMRLGNAS